MSKKMIRHSAYWYAAHGGWTASEEASYAGAYLDLHTYRPGGCQARAKEIDTTFNPLLLGVFLFVDVGLALRDTLAKVSDPAERARMAGELRRAARILRRPVYYARETERRRALAEERRKIRRRTTFSPMPTPGQVLAAWAARKTSKEAAIRLGGMLQDLECYVDNRLMIDEAARIRGRHGGIRGWLRSNLPELAPKYKTLMRYKAMAIRLRQATGTRDPVPTERLLEEVPKKGLVAEILADPRTSFESIWETLERQLAPGRAADASLSDGIAAVEDGECRKFGASPGTTTDRGGGKAKAQGGEQEVPHEVLTNPKPQMLFRRCRCENDV